MKKLIIYVIYFLSPVVIIAVLYINNMEKYNQTYYLVTLVSGATAYTWFMWQFILSGKFKVFRNIIGIKKIYILHGCMALVSIYLGILHGITLNKYYSFSTITVLGFLTIVLYMIISFMSLMFKKYLKLSHNFSLVALILMQIHVLLTSGASSYRSAFIVYNIYCIAAVNVYMYLKLIKPWMDKENIIVSNSVIENKVN